MTSVFWRTASRPEEPQQHHARIDDWVLARVAHVDSGVLHIDSCRYRVFGSKVCVFTPSLAAMAPFPYCIEIETNDDDDEDGTVLQLCVESEQELRKWLLHHLLPRMWSSSSSFKRVDDDVSTRRQASWMRIVEVVCSAMLLNALLLMILFSSAYNFESWLFLAAVNAFVAYVAMVRTDQLVGSSSKTNNVDSEVLPMASVLAEASDVALDNIDNNTGVCCSDPPRQQDEDAEDAVKAAADDDEPAQPSSTILAARRNSNNNSTSAITSPSSTSSKLVRKFALQTSLRQAEHGVGSPHSYTSFAEDLIRCCGCDLYLVPGPSLEQEVSCEHMLFRDEEFECSAATTGNVLVVFRVQVQHTSEHIVFSRGGNGNSGGDGGVYSLLCYYVPTSKEAAARLLSASREDLELRVAGELLPSSCNSSSPNDDDDEDEQQVVGRFVLRVARTSVSRYRVKTISGQQLDVLDFSVNLRRLDLLSKLAINALLAREAALLSVFKQHAVELSFAITWPAREDDSTTEEDFPQASLRLNLLDLASITLWS